MVGEGKYLIFKFWYSSQSEIMGIQLKRRRFKQRIEIQIRQIQKPEGMMKTQRYDNLVQPKPHKFVGIPK